ncbi:MAG: AAA family ATPase [Saprospiraceae bacterium]
MPLQITVPFHAFKLHLQDGDVVTYPLSDANALHIKKPIGELAKKYEEQFQKKMLDQGKFSSILDEIQQGEFAQKSFLLEFQAAKDGISYPAFGLEFTYFVQNVEERFWGIVPALGLETMAETEAELEERLHEVVKMDFTSKKRLSHVQYIISAIWFNNFSFETTPINYTFYSPTELAEQQKEEKQQLLPKVASKLEINKTIAYGREEEMNHLERILSSSFSKNILLVGASGSGKTALVWELAYRRKKQKEANHIWETTASVMIKELTMETGWQDNLSQLVKELTSSGDFLFVRNLSELFEVGQYQGNEVSMAEYLRPYISRGEITLITECTPEERARIELRSPNYLSFFQTIQLEEPKKGLEEIIRQKVDDMAGAKKVVFEDDAVDEVIRLHRRFSPYSGMPGKPIRFLESILLASSETPPTKKKKAKNKKKTEPNREQKVVEVSKQSVLHQYCAESGMPPFMVDPALSMDVEAVKKDFNEKVFGQERAVHTVVDLMAAVKTALTRTGKPIASFLFVGPTGVGKTELAKVVSEFMFGSRDRLLRFDMSEYSDPFSIMRLTGQGYYNDGLLTSAVRREPFSVLLFDEIEKADPTFYDLLLQIIGEGRLSDSQGKLVNFCSTIIIMTSNIGAARLQNNRIGWKKELDTAEVTDHFIREVEKNFKPELYNRIDSVVAFEPLSKEIVRAVVEREISLLKKREGIKFRRLDLNIKNDVLDYLAERGYDARYGARYLQRAIRERLVVPLAYTLNQFDYDDQLIVQVVLENDEIALNASSDPLAFELLMEQWDKLTLAEQTSLLRRKMMMMQEGPMFMRLQSELDLMEGEKNVDETKFWKDLERSNLYTNLLNMQERTDLLYNKIKQFEIEIALATMDQGPFDVDFENRLEAWETKYRQLLIHIISLLEPDNNQCYLSIYGVDFSPVLKFYLQLAASQDFQLSVAQTIWYREGFQGIDDDHPYLPTSAKTESPYIKRVVNENELQEGNFLPPLAGDKLYGVELQFTGPLSAVYFSHENGLQQWELVSKEPLNTFKVGVSNTYTPTPPNIFRQQFYQKPKPRRIVLQGEFIDLPLNLQVQVKQRDLAEYYRGVLDDYFKKVIEEFFL